MCWLEFCETVSSLFPPKRMCGGASGNFFQRSDSQSCAEPFAHFRKISPVSNLGATTHAGMSIATELVAPYGRAFDSSACPAAVRRVIMKATRFWIEILTLGAGVAFGLALALRLG